MNSIDNPQATKLNKRVFAMAGSSFFKRVRKVSSILATMIPILALSGCGEGDGPTRILNTAVTPLPPGFEDLPPTLGVFSETHTDPAVTIQDIQQAGNEVVITTETVRVFEGAVSLGLTFTTGGQSFGGSTILFDDADISSYNTLKFSIDTSSFANFANLTVQLEPPGGGTAGAFVALADYVPVATSGNWETYEIPLSALPAVDLALVNKLGFFNARDGSDTLLAGTLYLDDIHFTVRDFGSGASGTPIDPEVVLYATDGEPDLVLTDDYEERSALDSGSVIDPLYAEDETYSPVLAVFSGTDSGANVAQIGFIGFDPGFVTFYEDLIFKVKGMPNFVIFVSLYEGGDPLRINLTSSRYSEELENGWYQVSIPISTLTGRTTATGIVFESDDTAPLQFAMLLTDIGFSEADDGGNGGNGGNGGQASLGVYSETNTDPTVSITNIVSAGNTVTISESSDPVFDGAVSLELAFSTGGQGFGGAIIEFENADLSAYAVLKFAIDTSVFASFADLTVQLEPPPGGSAGNFVFLSSYVPVATSGNWETYEIPLADFTSVDPSSVNKLGFFNARDGGDVLLAGTLYLDDIHFSTAGGGGNGGGAIEGNIAINGGFESGDLSDWSLFPANAGDPNEQTVVTDNPKTGTYAGRINNTTPGTASVIKQANRTPVAIGQTATITFSARGSFGVGGVAFAEFFTELAGEGASSAQILGGGPLALNADPNVWTDFSFVVAIEADVSGGVTLQLTGTTGGDGGSFADVYYDDIAIVISDGGG